MVASPQISTMSPDACRVQLSSEHVGRVGLPGEPPDVIPVNYVYDEDAVIIRVDSSSVVARSVGRTVSFEVDQYDGDTRVGWSVLAAGVLDDVTTEVAVRWGTERQVRLYPWAPGNKDVWLRIRPIRLGGRSVRSGDATGDDDKACLSTDSVTPVATGPRPADEVGDVAARQRVRLAVPHRGRSLVSPGTSGQDWQ